MRWGERPLTSLSPAAAARGEARWGNWCHMPLTPSVAWSTGLFKKMNIFFVFWRVLMCFLEVFGFGVFCGVCISAGLRFECFLGVHVVGLMFGLTWWLFGGCFFLLQMSHTYCIILLKVEMPAKVKVVSISADDIVLVHMRTQWSQWISTFSWSPSKERSNKRVYGS